MLTISLLLSSHLSPASVPHYHVMSKVDVREGGLLHVPLNWIRKFLIESIYRRLSKSILNPKWERVRSLTIYFQSSRSPRPQSGPVPLTST